MHSAAASPMTTLRPTRSSANELLADAGGIDISIEAVSEPADGTNVTT